jgi:hypothetical protein
VSATPPRTDVPLAHPVDAQDELVFALPRKRFTRKPVTNPTVILVVVGVALFFLMCGGIAMMSMLGQHTFPDTGPQEGELASFDDVPPPVTAAVNRGEEVWEFTDWALDPGQKADRQSVYIVLHGSYMKGLIGKYHHPNSAEKDITWTKISTYESKEINNVTFAINWSFERTTNKHFTLTKTLEAEGANGIKIKTTISATANLNLSGGGIEGSWSGQVFTITTRHGVQLVPALDQTLAGGGVARVQRTAVTATTPTKKEATQPKKGSTQPTKDKVPDAKTGRGNQPKAAAPKPPAKQAGIRDRLTVR